MQFPVNQTLRALIDCHGDKYYKKMWWKKTQGYGLIASQFNGKDGCSRRMFSERKKFLHESKMIRILKSKERGVPFTITPLGICYFCSKVESIDAEIGIKIFRLLSTYSEYTLGADWKVIFSVITKIDALLILKRVCDSIEFKQIDDGMLVVLGYKSREGIFYEFTKYKLHQNQIRLQLAENLRIINVRDKTPTSTPTIDEGFFHKDVAEFIVQSFCYAIVEYYHWEILISTITMSNEQLTEREKLILKDKIANWENILARLPLEVHQTSVHFIGEKIFGRIKREQKLAKKISDHFSQKILSDAGFQFVDKKGKPFSMFSPKNLKLE